MSSKLYYLYPRLPQHIAQSLAEILIKKSSEERPEVWETTHDAATFAPTGGNRITSKSLELLRADVVVLAQRYGYPNIPAKNVPRRFDIDCGILLHEKMNLHPSEASHNEVWSFLACILLPDIARWRFSDSDDTARLVGKERGMRRHVFGRLWWRAYLAHNPRWEKPYALLYVLNEDDFVQVTERSSIAVRPALFRAFCGSFAEAAKTYSTLARRDLIREASKRMYRLLSLIAVEALTEQELHTLTTEIFKKTALALLENVELPAHEGA